MKIVGIIPSRFKSSRFEGKPLADIMGKPMIYWVCEQVPKVKGLDYFYVATDDDRIEEYCAQSGFGVIMTSENHPTGVDRLSEVATKVYANYYILIQGDEPLLEPETIEIMIEKIKENQDKENGVVYTFKTEITKPVDLINHTIIKIVTALDDKVLIASRSPVPYPKAGIAYPYYKSVGVYAYPRSVLLGYPHLIKGPLEQAEEHDFMRMLENGISIKAFTHKTETISVDTLKDLERVKSIMEKK